jgi:polyisoprenoid-binding protein YceI
VVGHLTRSLGWTWATLIVAVLLVGAIASVWWAFRTMRRAPSSRPRSAVLFGTPLVITTVAMTTWITIDEWDWLLEDGSVRSDGVSAPPVALDPGDELFRIGDGSVVTYRVAERLGGSDSTAVGTTTLVAGEIALNRARPSASELGEIVVNVEAFTSDSTLRDKRIRHDYLESTAYPYATFTPDTIVGLPDAPVDDGEPVEIEVTGALTVKETTMPATFAGTVGLAGDELTASLSTTVLMSDFDVGPIAVSGLVSTADEVDLEFDLVARSTDSDAEPGDDTAEDLVTASETTVPVSTSMPVADPIGSEPIESQPVASFAGQVRPILEQRCASCHGPGGPGESTVAFSTAGEAAAIADDIGLVTQTGYMPPWPAGPRSVAFEHDWSLTIDEIADLREWIEAGAPLDVDADARLVPAGDQISEVDADETLRGEPYTGSEARRDDYRCQIYPLSESDEPRWITSYAMLPDEVEIVHHGILFRADADSLDEALALDALDEQPGWACFGLAGINGVDQIGGWAPGQQPTVYPEGSGMRLEPGDFLVIQLHYHYDHDYPADESAIAIDLASDEEIAAAGGALTDVVVERYLAPAEVPCRDDERGPLCDRDAVIEEIRGKFGDFAALIPNGLIGLCGADLDAMMADTDGVTHASCEYDVANPGEIVSVLGHMHEFGRTFTMTLNPGTPEERILLDIPNWSFEWQFNFRPVEKIVVDRSDVLRIECTWDRSLAPMPEPRHITWNEGTDDEMCYSTLATIDPGR